MKRVLIVLLLATPLFAQTLDERVSREINSLVETYKTLHAAPELSTQEAKTSAFVASRLRQLGYEVTERVGKYSDPNSTCYGVVAIMRNGTGPTLLVRSDMDALPVTEQTGLAYASQNSGVMHACGHDVHMTTLLGTAKILADLKSQWRGTLMLVGQPAEEVVKGAEGMLSDGLYERFGRPDFAIALHDDAVVPTGKIGYRPGDFMAATDSVNLTIRGMGGHGKHRSGAQRLVLGVVLRRPRATAAARRQRLGTRLHGRRAQGRDAARPACGRALARAVAQGPCGPGGSRGARP